MSLSFFDEVMRDVIKKYGQVDIDQYITFEPNLEQVYLDHLQRLSKVEL